MLSKIYMEAANEKSYNLYYDKRGESGLERGAEADDAPTRTYAKMIRYCGDRRETDKGETDRRYADDIEGTICRE